MRISDWSSDVCSSDLRSPSTQIIEHSQQRQTQYGEVIAADFRKQLCAHRLQPITADATRNRRPFMLKILIEARVGKRPNRQPRVIDRAPDRLAVDRKSTRLNSSH